MLATLPIFATGGAMAAGNTATGSSSAVSGTLTVQGFPSDTLSPQLPATYTAPPTGKATPVVKKNFSATHTYYGQIALTTKAKSVTDTASGALASGATTATGGSTIVSPSLAAVAQGKNILTASATKILSTAHVSKTQTGKVTTKGTTTLTGLTVTSSLFGLNIQNLDVTATPNQVLAKNSDGTAKVIANYQVPVKTGGKVTGVNVSAIDVHLSNFKYGAYVISGDIAIANSAAK